MMNISGGGNSHHTTNRQDLIHTLRPVAPVVTVYATRNRPTPAMTCWFPLPPLIHGCCVDILAPVWADGYGAKLQYLLLFPAALLRPCLG